MIKQSSFAKGEIAPALFARTDLAAYAIGLRTLRNFFVAKQGGAYNRPGTTYVAATKYSDLQVRLIEFVFGTDDAYVLEFGLGYIRFFRNGARVLVSGVAAWSSSTAYSQGALASFGGINYYCNAANTNKTPPNLNYWYPLEADIFEVQTSYTVAQVLELQTVQSGDVVIIVHKDQTPRELIRTGNTAWTLSSINFGPTILPVPTPIFSPLIITPGVPVISWQVTAVGVDGEESLPTSVGRTQTQPTEAAPQPINWTAVTGAVQYNIYRFVGATGPSALTEGLIGSSATNSFSDAAQVAELGTAPANPDPFHQGTGNFPSVAKFSQQRLILAGTPNNPEQARASRIGSYKNFTTRLPVQDDDAVTFSLVGNQVNQIRHILELRQTVFLTSAVEWAINGDSAGILRPDAINAKRHSYNGSSIIPPLNVSGSALYVQARGSVIRDLGFSFEQDSYTGNDLTIMSSHLFEGKTISDWAFAQIPHPLVWVVLNDGSFVSLTYIKEQEMLAWARHDTDGAVENVAVIPDGSEDRVYLVVKRTLPSDPQNPRRYIEILNTRQVDAVEDCIYMDSALTYDGAPVSTVSGLDHLEGKEVAILADGFVLSSPNNPAYPTKTVTNGSVALGRAYSKIHVGLPFISDIETLDGPTFANENKIVTKVLAFIEKSRGFFSGAKQPELNATQGLTETKLRTDESYNEPIRLHTQEVPLNIKGEYTKGGRVFIRNIDPLPLAVLSITPLGFLPGGR